MLNLSLPDESAPDDSTESTGDADGETLLQAIEAKDPVAIVEAIKRIAG